MEMRYDSIESSKYYRFEITVEKSILPYHHITFNARICRS
jgi:hypothetical protein